jgi:LuxR family maltose regulon positive regulatory protein
LGERASPSSHFTQGDYRGVQSAGVGAEASEVVVGEPAATSGPVILETKLTVPSLRSEHVARPVLLELLRASTERPLTVLTAPPGFGKTTLLAAWAAQAAERVAWLSLDHDDNDPVRFFAYVIGAMRTVEPQLGAHASAALASAGARLVDAVLPLLLNDLTAREGRVVLILDDYHLIDTPEIDEALAYLIDHIPSSLRVVLATREDPALPVARLRARGQLGELRANQLRFSADETAVFLNDALGLALAEQDVERLQTRTEGWPAALYLAALSLRDRPDPTRVIDAFAGDDRHVVDYLTSEVLARQPTELRSFLLRTSVLTRLCGSLCDAVTETEGSAQLLAELERSNLLLIPLDGRREWYRYHQLFGELLQHELARAAPGELPLLHRRASAWYRDAGLVVDAANHATAAGDTDAAVDIVGRHWHQFLGDGQLATVERWLQALPESAIREQRTLCFAAAIVTSRRGRLAEADEWLTIAERIPSRPGVEEETQMPLEAMRAWVRLLRGDLEGVIALARAQTAPAPHRALPTQLLLSQALWWIGQLADAQATLDAALRTVEAGGPSAELMFALGLRAAVDFELGDAADAETRALRALELTRLPEFEEHPFAAMSHLVVGRVQTGRSERGAAIAAIERGIQLAERFNAWPIVTYGVLALAEVRHVAHEPAVARRLLARARAIVGELPEADAGVEARIEWTERALRLRPVPEAGAFWELSERELTVLRLLASKLSQREIAGELYVSFNTLKTHTRAIFRKLGAASRAEAVARARELGLL